MLALSDIKMVVQESSQAVIVCLEYYRSVVFT